MWSKNSQNMSVVAPAAAAHHGWVGSDCKAPQPPFCWSSIRCATPAAAQQMRAVLPGLAVLSSAANTLWSHMLFRNVNKRKRKEQHSSVLPLTKSRGRGVTAMMLPSKDGAGCSFASSLKLVIKWESKGTEQNKTAPNLKSVILLLSSSSLCLFLSSSRRSGHASSPNM